MSSLFEMYGYACSTEHTLLAKCTFDKRNTLFSCAAFSVKATGGAPLRNLRICMKSLHHGIHSFHRQGR